MKVAEAITEQEQKQRLLFNVYSLNLFIKTVREAK